MRAIFKCLILLCLLHQGMLCAQIREDHLLHFGAGMLTGAGGAFIASELSHQDRWWTFTGAVAASVLAGVAKEAIDAGQADNKWDNSDLAATALGGVTIGVTIDLFTARARKRRRGGVVISDPVPLQAADFSLINSSVLLQRRAKDFSVNASDDGTMYFIQPALSHKLISEYR